MRDLVYKNYMLSSGEFMVLASCAGMEKLPVLFEKSAEDIDEKELNLILFGLFRKEFLFWESEDVYCLKPEISEIFREMMDAKDVLQISSRGQGSELLCFVGQNIVITEMSRNDDSVVRVSRRSKEAFFTELCDREILSEEDALSLKDESENISLESLKEVLEIQANGEEVRGK